MKTDHLVAILAEDLTPVRPLLVLRVLLLGLVGGMMASAAIMIPWLGVRPDMGEAMMTVPFWIKFAYTLILAVAGFWLVGRQARAGGRAISALTLGAIAVLAMTGLAVAQLMPADAPRHGLIMGSSANVCTRNIFILSLPIFIGLLWAMRQLAPTRLVLAGTSAGLLAGAAGAWIYAFHCNESTAPFMVVWYTLGIAAVGLLGAITGRWALHW